MSSAYASTTPANDLYSDSLTIERASAEVPGSLDATPGSDSVSGASAAASADDEQPIESVSDLTEAAKPAKKKSARK